MGVVMTEQDLNSQFARRINRNNTVDSICLRCFRTVATTPQRDDPIKEETGHVCLPGESLIENLNIRFRRDADQRGPRK